MKKIILDICFYINVALLVFAILITISVFFEINFLVDFALGDKMPIVRILFNVPIIFLWVSNMVIWSKYDKNIGRFFLLFFLNAFYNPFYYRKVVINKWI